MSDYKIYKNDLPNDIKFACNSIAIDTEAMGLNIHRDRLCLVQISDSNGKVYLVQFDGKDYSAPNLKKILLDQSIIKIFHFARFDVAIMRYYLKLERITPIFCTKIASRLTRTFTDLHGLKSICRDLLGVELNKESQTTDWGSEILTTKQLRYAENDVLYLHKLRDALLNMLDRMNRRDIAFEMFDVMHTVCTLDILDFNASEIINH